MKRHHAIARPELGDAAAHRGHHAGGLVPVDARRRQQIVFDLLQIGVADAASFHADQNLAGADRRRRDLLHGDDAARRDTPRRAWLAVWRISESAVGKKFSQSPRGPDTPFPQPDHSGKRTSGMTQSSS